MEPRRTIVAIMMMAVLYFTTLVATAVPKALAASFVPSDQPIKRPAKSNKYIIFLYFDPSYQTILLISMIWIWSAMFSMISEISQMMSRKLTAWSFWERARPSISKICW